MGNEPNRGDALYLQAAAEFGPALARLARAYEADVDQRRDLLQDIHFALWRSLPSFEGQCSLRTWVYRVAHNVGISGRLRRRKPHLVSLDDLAAAPALDSTERTVDDARALTRLHLLIRQLKTSDCQVILLYLEDLDAASISEITALSPRAVATRVHRIKALLAHHFRQGEIP